MKVITREVESIKELNTLYNRFVLSPKRNVFKHKRDRKKKVIAQLIPLDSAYVEIVDDLHDYTIRYVLKSRT